MKYNVYGRVVGSKFLGTFEAENPQRAEKMALKENGHVSLCYHCADECENAEIDDVIVEPADD
jgi:hypothetical protein